MSKYKVIHLTAECLTCGNHGSYCEIEVSFLGNDITAYMCPKCVKEYDKGAEFENE